MHCSFATLYGGPDDDDVTCAHECMCCTPCRVDVSFHESKAGADDVVALLSDWWPKPFTTDK
jgi:hypothetical protein